MPHAHRRTGASRKDGVPKQGNPRRPPRAVEEQFAEKACFLSASIGVIALVVSIWTFALCL
jgi:hypothetical protein